MKIIVATKADLAGDDGTLIKSGLEFAESVNLPHFSTSAKSGTGVSEVFTEATRFIIKAKGDSLKKAMPVGGLLGNNVASS